MESSDIKVLGAPIGRPISAPTGDNSDIDGDGDGFITRGGKDNVPAPKVVKKIVEASNVLKPRDLTLAKHPGLPTITNGLLYIIGLIVFSETYIFG